MIRCRANVVSTLVLLSLLVVTGQAMGTQVAIRVWASEVPEWVTLTDKALDRFRSENPDINVLAERASGNVDQMTVHMASGAAPDIIGWWGGSMQDWGEHGFFLRLDGLMQTEMSERERADFLAPHLAAFRDDAGAQYALPFVGGTIAMWYNKVLFDEAGIAYPTASWGHLDLLDNATKLSKDLNGDHQNDQWGYGFWNTFERAELWVRRFGGRAHPAGSRAQFLWDTPQAISGLRFLGTLGQERRAFGGSFYQGTQAMYEDGSWMLTSFGFGQAGFDFDFAPVPSGPAGKVSYLTTNAYAINADTQHPKQAFAVLRFLTGTYANQMRSQASLQPAVRSALPFYIDAQTVTYPRLKGANLQAFVEALSYAIPAPSLRNHTKVIKPIDAFLSELVFKGTKPAEAVKEIVSVVNQLLRE